MTGSESLSAARDSRLSALQKMTDKELTDAVAEFCEDAAGFYSVPRDCVCGEQHLSRQTYWNHRIAAESAREAE